jgi:hypothetical protein
MASSGMLRRVALVGTDVSEKLSASFIRVIRIGELGTTLALTSSPILVTLMKEALSFSETSVRTRATRRNIPKDVILQVFTSSNFATIFTEHLTLTPSERQALVFMSPSDRVVKAFDCLFVAF